MTSHRGTLERGGHRSSGTSGREPTDEEPGIERVARAGRVGRGQVLGSDLQADPFVTDTGEDRGALRTPLDDRDRGDIEQPVEGASADERFGFGRGREQQVRRGPFDQSARRSPSAGQQRPDRGEVDADRHARVARELDRPPAGRSERLAEQRVCRQVERVRALEPRGPEVARLEQVGGAAVGHEAAFAAGLDDDPDPAGPGTGHARDARGDAIGPDRIDQRPASGIAPDRGDEARLRAETAEPARRGGGRAALDERDPAGDVRARFERLCRGHDHVEHQVAQDHDPGRPARRAGADPPGTSRAPRSGRASRSSGSRHGGHEWRIARPPLQWPDPLEVEPNPQRRSPPDDPRHRSRPARHRHHPHAVHRRRAEGELGSPGRADGCRTHGVRAVDALPASRADPPGLARPRPLRAECRSRRHAALRAPPPDRLRGLAGGPRGVPAVGQHHAGPPGARA